MDICFHQVSFVEVVAVVEAEKHFPHKTPKRWSLIAEYMMKMNDALKKERGVVCGEPTMLLGSGARTVTFCCCAEHCKQLWCDSDVELQPCSEVCRSARINLCSDPSLSAFKPVVLLPKVICCGHSVSIKYNLHCKSIEGNICEGCDCEIVFFIIGTEHLTQLFTPQRVR